jgi:hypothetical protein
VERISLRGICRAVGVTLKWLLGFPHSTQFSGGVCHRLSKAA